VNFGRSKRRRVQVEPQLQEEKSALTASADKEVAKSRLKKRVSQSIVKRPGLVKRILRSRTAEKQKTVERKESYELNRHRKNDLGTLKKEGCGEERQSVSVIKRKSRPVREK